MNSNITFTKMNDIVGSDKPPLDQALPRVTPNSCDSSINADLYGKDNVEASPEAVRVVMEDAPTDSDVNGLTKSEEKQAVEARVDSTDMLTNLEKGIKNAANELETQLSALGQRLRAYVGPIEEAEEHTVDNKFIVRGYRINHNTCGRLTKSLCTCHNEFVNVWSHICGVLVFIIMITVICIMVLPKQFWYAKELNTEFSQYQDEGGPLSESQNFIDTKIEDLILLSNEAAVMPVSSTSEVNDFEDSMTDIMYRIEGISHFTIENFYSFQYMNEETGLFDDATETELVNHWFATFTGYNLYMLQQLTLSQQTITSA